MLLVKGAERDGGLSGRTGKDAPGDVGGRLVHHRRHRTAWSEDGFIQITNRLATVF